MKRCARLRSWLENLKRSRQASTQAFLQADPHEEAVNWTRHYLHTCHPADIDALLNFDAQLSNVYLFEPETRSVRTVTEDDPVPWPIV